MTLVLLCYANIMAYGQQPIAVTGEVRDEAQTPMEFVNVVLLQKSDSSFVTGTTTDASGRFSMPYAGNLERYLLKASFIGYQPYFTQPSTPNVGAITLRPDATMLAGVEVVGNAPRFKMSGEGVTATIRDSRLSDLGTAMDVLGQLPFVSAKDEALTVFGRGTPIVYINGRRMYDDTELSKLSSNDIKSVDIVLNPGAEYPADVKSVIKIETVKKRGEGISGYVRGRFTKSRLEAGEEQLDLMYQRGGWELTGGIYARQLRQVYDFDFTTTYDNLDAAIHNWSTAPARDRQLNPYGGISYSWKEKQSVGMKFQHIEYTNDAVMTGGLTAHGTGLEQDLLTRELSGMSRYRNYLNAYYSGTIAKNLTAKWDVDYAYGHNPMYQDVTYLSDGKETERIVTDTRLGYRLFATKLVLTTPAWKGQWTYGVDYSYTRTKQSFDTNEAGEEHELANNQNTIKQDSRAAFARYDKSFGKFSAAAGLRYERVEANYYEHGQKVDGQSRAYHDLFPSINLSYAGDLQATLNYSRSVDRPSYWALRSSTQYDNAYWLEIGNPYLRPQITDQLSLMLQWKDLQASVDYNIAKDVYSVPSTQSEKNPAVVISKYENFDEKELSAYISYSPKVGLWQPALDCSFYKQYRKYAGRTFNKPTYEVEMKNSFAFRKKWQFGLNARVYTSGHSDFNYRYGMFRLDAYLTGKLCRDKLVLSLVGNNILNTEKVKTVIDMNHLFIRNITRQDTRNVRLSIAYRFNATKSKYKGEQATGEMNRL
jgi:hypothetical protein